LNPVSNPPTLRIGGTAPQMAIIPKSLGRYGKDFCSFHVVHKTVLRFHKASNFDFYADPWRRAKGLKIIF
jgi:hypothetical protein